MSVKHETNVGRGEGGIKECSSQQSVLNIIRYSHSDEETRDLGAPGTESGGYCDINGSTIDRGTRRNNKEESKQGKHVGEDTVKQQNYGYGSQET